jgi:MFS transporter, DHA1 family, inner membrane transport protein
MTVPLLILSFANFVVGMGAFVVVGVMTPVAEAFGIGRPEAGWLLTAYAIVYAIASPVLVAFSGAIDRRRVLCVGTALFGLGALLAALAPTYALLLAARALMAIGGGLVTPVAAAVGVALAGPENRGRALAWVFGGLTLAQVVGVPFGAWLGYTFGWASAFVAVAVLSALALPAMWRMLPERVAVPVVSGRTLVEVLATPRLMLAVVFTVLFIGGLYVVYTFLAPLLESRLSLKRDGVTAMLVLFGAGAVVGNALGGRLTDRIGAAPTLALLCATQLVWMPLITLWPLGVAGTAVLVAAWSVCAWSFMVPQQARLATLDPARVSVLFALNAAAIYVGASIGSAIGGAVLRAQGFAMLGVGGAAIVLLAAMSLWLAGKTGSESISRSGN